MKSHKIKGLFGQNNADDTKVHAVPFRASFLYLPRLFVQFETSDRPNWVIAEMGSTEVPGRKCFVKLHFIPSTRPRTVSAMSSSGVSISTHTNDLKVFSK